MCKMGKLFSEKMIFPPTKHTNNNNNNNNKFSI